MKRILLLLSIFFTILAFAQQDVVPFTPFGNMGIVSSTPSYFKFIGIAIQPDQKIVTAGYLYESGADNLKLCRYTSDGTLDTSFGTGGTVSLSAPFDNEQYSSCAKKIKVQDDGKILIIMNKKYPNNYSDFRMLRFNSDGTPDAGFGNNGEVLLDADDADSSSAVDVDQEGRIILVGSTNGGFVIARFNSDGTSDTSFNGGYLVAEYPSPPYGSQDRAMYFQIQTDGKIVIGGDEIVYTASNHDFAVLRINIDGTIDTSFGSNGWVTADWLNTESLTGLLLAADGKILAMGVAVDTSTWPVTPGYIAVAKFNSDGSPDLSFAPNGRKRFQVTTSDTLQYFIRLHDGTILGVGHGSTGDELVSFNEDFSLNTAFDQDGIAILPGTNYYETVAEFENGNILCGGGKLGEYTFGTLDMRDFGKDSLISVYPNPFESYIDIDFPLSGEPNISAELLDIGGRIICGLPANTPLSEKTNQKRIEMPELASGLYFLKLVQNGSTTFVRILRK